MSAVRSFSSLPPPLSINAPFEGYLKLVKATRKGEKLKQGCDVTGDRTRDTPRAAKAAN